MFVRRPRARHVFIAEADMQIARNLTPRPSTPVPVGGTDPRAAQILARSLYRDMVQNGLSAEQILAVAGELIDRVTQEIKQSPPPSGQA